MGNNPSVFKGDDLPVERVSWYDAIVFCNKKSEKEGLKPVYTINQSIIDKNNLNFRDDIRWKVDVNKNANGYRLPTEAEWEYAARGGNQTKGFTFSGSNNPDEVAWYGFTKSGRQTHVVGTKNPNELGIYDMSGNVYEWCWDWYSSYTNTSYNNPIGPEYGEFRILRGGSWLNNVSYCRVSNRCNYYPNDNTNIEFGFRLVRNAR